MAPDRCMHCVPGGITAKSSTSSALGPNYLRVIHSAPSTTWSPAATARAATVMAAPSLRSGAVTLTSIFMADTIASVSPGMTLSPVATSSLSMTPGMGDPSSAGLPASAMGPSNSKPAEVSFTATVYVSVSLLPVRPRVKYTVRFLFLSGPMRSSEIVTGCDGPDDVCAMEASSKGPSPGAHPYSA